MYEILYGNYSSAVVMVMNCKYVCMYVYVCVLCVHVYEVCVYGWVGVTTALHTLHHIAAMNRFDELLKQVAVHHLERMEQSSS